MYPRPQDVEYSFNTWTDHEWDTHGALTTRDILHTYDNPAQALRSAENLATPDAPRGSGGRWGIMSSFRSIGKRFGPPREFSRNASLSPSPPPGSRPPRARRSVVHIPRGDSASDASKPLKYALTPPHGSAHAARKAPTARGRSGTGDTSRSTRSGD